MCTPLAILDTCELYRIKKKNQFCNKPLPEAEQSAVNMLVPAYVHPPKY